MRQAGSVHVGRQSLEVAKRKGGWLAVSGGIIWEGVGISHNLAYMWELVSRSEFAQAAGYLHLSPLFTIGIGIVWVVLGHREKEAEVIQFEGASVDPWIPRIVDDGTYDYDFKKERRDANGNVETITLKVSRHLPLAAGYKATEARR
jgi:hypothetical protein